MDDNPPGSPQPPDTNWQFKADPEREPADLQAVAVPPSGAEGSISWTASEFIAHHKSPGWYLALTIAAVGLALLIWFLTKDKISVLVVLCGAAVFGSYAARKPRQLEYRLDEHGLVIGQRQFSYGQFRSFAVVPEGAFSSIVFSPLKRFMPPITIYYAPPDEPKIIALLSDRLPFEHNQGDLIDRFMRRIRF